MPDEAITLTFDEPKPVRPTIKDPISYSPLSTGEESYGSSCNRCGGFVTNEDVHSGWHVDIEKLKPPKPPPTKS